MEVKFNLVAVYNHQANVFDIEDVLRSKHSAFSNVSSSSGFDEFLLLSLPRFCLSVNSSNSNSAAGNTTGYESMEGNTLS